MCRAAAGVISCRGGVHDWMAGRKMQQRKELGKWARDHATIHKNKGDEGHGFNVPRPEAGASSLPTASAYSGISAPPPMSSPSAMGTAYVTLAAARAAPSYAVQQHNNRVRIRIFHLIALHCTVIQIKSGLPLACTGLLLSPNMGTAYTVGDAVELSWATITCACLWIPRTRFAAEMCEMVAG